MDITSATKVTTIYSAKASVDEVKALATVAAKSGAGLPDVSVVETIDASFDPDGKIGLRVVVDAKALALAAVKAKLALPADTNVISSEAAVDSDGEIAVEIVAEAKSPEAPSLKTYTVPDGAIAQLSSVTTG